MRRRRPRGDPLLRASPRGGNFEDPHTGYRGNILHVVDPRRGPPRRRSTALPPAAARGTRRHACVPGSTTRCCSAGTRCSCARSPRRRSRSGATTGWTRRARTPGSSLRELRRDDGRLLRSWQGGRAHLLAYAEDYAALLEALLTLAELDDVAVARRGADRRRRSRPAVRRRRAAAASSPPAPTPKRSSCARRTTRTTRRRRRTPSPPTASSASPRSPATPTLRGTRRRGGSRTLAPVLGEHPTAFAYLLEALERLVTPPLEVAVVGDARRSRHRRHSGRELRAPAAPGVRADRRPRRARAPSSRRCSPTATPSTDAATAYVCEHFACRLPVTDPEALERSSTQRSRPASTS